MYPTNRMNIRKSLLLRLWIIGYLIGHLTSPKRGSVNNIYENEMPLPSHKFPYHVQTAELPHFIDGRSFLFFVQIV